MFRVDIGMDLGTSSIAIYMRDKGIVIRQPSVIAVERKTRKIIAVGAKAKRMTGRTLEGIDVISPIRRGVISDYTMAERMIRAFYKNALKRKKIWGRPNVCVTVPMGITEVQKRAVEDAITRTGARNMFLIEYPLAAALGAGIDIMETKGRLVIDIGGGTTDVAMISAGSIACGESVPIAGDDFTDAIIRYVRRKYNVELGPLSAEDGKIEVASVIQRANDNFYEVKGKNLVNGLPARVELSGNETAEALEEITGQLLDCISHVIETAPPELAGDATISGILLSGGGSRLSGLAKRIEKHTGIHVIQADEPENAAAAGAGHAGELIMVREEENRSEND